MPFSRGYQFTGGLLINNKNKTMKQTKIFEDKIELIQVDSVIGSGYETKVAELALIDKIAYRAARIKYSS